MTGTITLDHILNHWDADKIMGISRTLMSLHKTHNSTVDQVKNALSVINADWSGKAADESLRAILQTLDDLTDHSEKVKALAKDFSIASEEVNILRRQVKTLQESIAHVPDVTLQLTENKVVTDSHDTETLNKVRNFTKTIAQILAAAHKVDTDLANAIKYVEGIIPSDPITDGPFTDDTANDGTHMDCEYDLLPNGKRVQLPKGAWLESNPQSDGSIVTTVHHPDGSIDKLIKPPTHISDVNKWMSEHYDPANHIYPDPTTFGPNQGFQKAGCFAELIGTPYRWNGGHDAYGPTLVDDPAADAADFRGQPGIDCSGLQAYLNYLTMDNPPQRMGTGLMANDPNKRYTPIDESQLQIGDIVVCQGSQREQLDPTVGVWGTSYSHTMMYLGKDHNGNPIWAEASESGDVVKVSPSQPPQHPIVVTPQGNVPGEPPIFLRVT